MFTRNSVIAFIVDRPFLKPNCLLLNVFKAVFNFQLSWLPKFSRKAILPKYTSKLKTTIGLNNNRKDKRKTPKKSENNESSKVKYTKTREKSIKSKGAKRNENSCRWHGNSDF